MQSFANFTVYETYLCLRIDGFLRIHTDEAPVCSHGMKEIATSFTFFAVCYVGWLDSLHTYFP